MSLRKVAYKILLFSLTPLLFSCGADFHLRKADQHFAIGEYFNAAEMYRKAYTLTSSSKKDDKAKSAFMAGECFRKTNYYSKALSSYRNAIRYNYSDSLVFRHLADIQLQYGDFKNAEKNYLIFLESYPSDILAINGLLSCQLSQEWRVNPTRYIVKKEAVFNSRFNDYSPVFYGDNNDKLYLTSTRNDATGSDNNGISGMKNCDIFVSEKDSEGKWQKPIPIEGGPNSEYEDGSCAFDPNLNTMYFTRCPYDQFSPRPAQIMLSVRQDAEWKSAKPFDDKIDTIYSYAHPAISPDGKWLYFVSDLPGGYGGLDIWRIPIDGRLIGAENLGPSINTPGDEMFPTFRNNGNLYFSSNGHPGMGGLDIFEAKNIGDTLWSVVNMQYPINSFADDFGITFENNLNRGFFSSNRDDARGRDNIYSFYLPEIVHTLTGWVYEKDGYELTEAKVHIVSNDGLNLKTGVKSNGSFSIRVNPGISYLLLGTSKGYMNYKQEITADSLLVDREYVLQFPLSSISKPVLIDNILFDFDKATLRPESTENLKELAVLLNDNPNVTIEIGAHSDYKGDEVYNRNLSQQRAESVVNFLTACGIKKERLSAKGYGENQPAIVSKKNSELYPFLTENQVLTEEFIMSLPEDKREICNQLNRRTEFRVLRTTYDMFD
ncbi:MAG TPA: OmpA family protein [Bacteroidaceae bacterium]|nr:OmpA family protein [Bacteroidaceae bacterium]